MGVARVDQLADSERARFDEWADKWIEIGLQTGPADRERFEASVQECYRFAGIDWPGVVVWVPSPLVMSIAAPAAAYTIELLDALARRGQLGSGAVDGAVDDAVRGAVRGAVDDAVDGAVRGAVRGAVDGADAEAIRRGVVDVLASGVWWRAFGGQFQVGGWYWGGAYNSFLREVCDLEMPGDLWDRARAFEGTMESACWWWPHRRFVMVCERPSEIHRELVVQDVPRGWGSHRLHREDGPAVEWPDGWGVYSVHGTRVPRQVVEAPETLTVKQITDEPNAEIRRVMLERFGIERYIRESDAKLLDESDWGKLWCADLDGDEPLVMVEVLNSTPEPDGSVKTYFLRVHPELRPMHAEGARGRPQKPTALNAIASTFGLTGGEYTKQLVAQT